MSEQWQPPAGGARDAKAQRAADKAYAKAQRPWYKKKRFIIPGAFIGLVILGAALGGGETATTDPVVAAPAATETTEPTVENTAAAPAPEPTEEVPPPAPANVFPGQLEDDRIAQPGETVAIEDWQITATPLEEREGFGESVLCTDITLVNVSDETEDYNALSFSLQDPQGGIQEFGTISADGAEPLSAGSAAPGGTVTGSQCYEQRGAGQYVFLYQPNAFTGSGGRVAYVNTL